MRCAAKGCSESAVMFTRVAGSDGKYDSAGKVLVLLCGDHCVDVVGTHVLEPMPRRGEEVG